MQLDESHIENIAKDILGAKESFHLSNLKDKVLNRMMDSEDFRIAALRFTDVAPSLRTNNEFHNHLRAYFSEVDILGTMLDENFIGSSLVAKAMSPVVRHNINSMAKTFIAGETIKEGLKTLRQLHNHNIAPSVDILGEAVITRKEAQDFTNAYLEAIEELSNEIYTWPKPSYPEQDDIGVIARANFAIKLSALYEHINIAAHEETKEEISKRLRLILDKAVEFNVYVHIDVEQFEFLPLTLDIFTSVLMETPYRNYPNVGIVCQAYLKDSEKILRQMIQFSKDRGTPFSIRLVKGAYWDYEQANAEQLDWPCPVFNKKEDTDLNFEKLTSQLIAGFPHVRPLIGSHNARSLAVAISAAEKYGLNKADIEFQMLFGMAEPFRDYLVSKGYRVRQYCPIGEFIPGMSYLVRRLLENTANQSFLRMHGRGEAEIDALVKKPVSPGKERKKDSSFTNHPLMDFSLIELRQKAQQALEQHQPPYQVNPSAKKHFTHTCPWDSSLTVTKVGFSTIKQVDQAIEKAKSAQEHWQKIDVIGRAEILELAATITTKRWDELFALQVYEAGKDWVHADADIAEGIDFLRYYAQQMRSLESRFQPNSLWGEVNKTIYEPRGITAIIAPWNFPFAISAGMTSAALIAGNPVLYKPAEQTSAIGQFLADIYKEAGVPDGIFNFIPGKGEEVGAHMVSHPVVSTIGFTGSREVGLKIVEESGKTVKGQKGIKKCIIEMGGKNAIIIDSDADLDEAVPATVNSAFSFQGQKCSACSRVIIVGSAYEPFVARLKEMVTDLRVGEANNPLFDVSAVIDKEAFDKIENYIKIGKKDGKLLAQAKLNETLNGHFAPPTVFTDLKENSKLTTDEVFGPILTVYRADSIEHALKLAQDNDYALTGGLFSRNPETIEQVKNNYKVGNLYINRGITGALVGRQPFGGAALSGTGSKAGGPDYLLHFLEPRVITENTMRRGYAPKE